MVPFRLNSLPRLSCCPSNRRIRRAQSVDGDASAGNPLTSIYTEAQHADADAEAGTHGGAGEDVEEGATPKTPPRPLDEACSEDARPEPEEAAATAPADGA